MNPEIKIIRRNNDELMHYGVKGMKWDKEKRNARIRSFMEKQQAMTKGINSANMQSNLKIKQQLNKKSQSAIKGFSNAIDNISKKMPSKVPERYKDYDYYKDRKGDVYRRGKLIKKAK